LTEILVVLAISIAAFGAAGYLVRWLVGQPSGDAEMSRVASLVQSGADGFARRQSSIIGALAALLGGVLFLAYGLRPAAGDVVPGFELGVWLTLSFAVGASSALVTSRAATWVSTRGAVRAAAAAQRSVDAALQASVRAGGAVSLGIGAASALTTSGLVLALLVYHGALGEDPIPARALVPVAPWLVLGHALGASFAALLMQLSGGSFSKAADIGADVGAREAGLDDDAAENPATVADLAGDCAGGTGNRAAASFATAACEDLVMMLALALVYAADTELKNALALVMLPLVVRALGQLGTAFATFIVRTDEREDPQAAVFRGLVVALVVHAFGLVGAVEWLLPARRGALVACAAIGGVLGIAVIALTNFFVGLRFRTARDAADAARGGATTSLLSGLGSAIDATIVPLVLGGAAFAGAWLAGGALGGPAGGVLGLVAVGLGVSGGVSYFAALETSASILDAASGIVGMTVGRTRPDVRGRLMALEAPGATHRCVARVLPATSALAAVPLVDLLIHHEALRRGAPPGQAPTSPWVLLGAALGSALVLWLFARCAADIQRVSRRLIDEVRRQLRDRPSVEPEVAEAKTRAKNASRRPDYGPCVEVAGRLALRNMLLPGLAAVAAPALFAVGLRFVAESDMGGAAVGSIASLITGAMVVGSLGALLGTFAGGTWGNAKKYIVTGAHGGRLLVDETGARAENPTFHAAIVGDTVGDPLKDGVAPALIVFVRLLPMLMLVLLPLFF
jgi:K(+)-stimulated pyrophosphate-energized sodium pump